MEDAYRMRERHEELKKREKVKHPISGEAVGLGTHDRSLNDIFSDRRGREADLFLNLYLHKKNPTMAKEIARKRAIEPKPEVLLEAEEKFLEDNRESFNVLRAESDLMRDLLNGEQLIRMKRSDKDVDEIVGMIGADSAAAFLGDQLEELALTAEPRFRRLIDSLKAADEVQSGKVAERNEKRISQYLVKYGITKEQYEEATVEGLAGATPQRLAELTKKQLSGWRSALDFVSFGRVSKWRAGNLYNTLAERERLLEEADGHLGSVIKVLHGTLSRDEIKRAYQNQGFAEGTQAPSYTVMSIQDYRRFHKEFHLDKIEEDFKRYRAQEARKLGRGKYWNDDDTTNLLDRQKEKIVNTYLKDKKTKKERENARGLFKVMTDEIFTATYDTDLETKVNSIN